MPRDLDDLATDQVIARICGRPVAPLPDVPAAWLLDGKPKPDAWQWCGNAVPRPPKNAHRSDSDRSAK